MKAMGILVRYGYAVVFGTVLGEQIGLSQAAAALGLSRTRFYTLLRRYGLS